MRELSSRAELVPRIVTLQRLQGPGAPAVIAFILVFMTVSALVTQVLGVHGLFGAFLAGVVMPRARELHDYLAVRLAYFSGVFLLPLFFAFSGLRMQINLLGDPGRRHWGSGCWRWTARLGAAWCRRGSPA